VKKSDKKRRKTERARQLESYMEQMGKDRQKVGMSDNREETKLKNK